MSRKSPSKPPEVHTVLVVDSITMWEKLCWDVEQFQDIQRSYPKERQPLAFAAINVCIAAWSLEQWAKIAWIKKMRSEGKEVSGFSTLVRQNVPGQGICADVANTSKHANHRDEDWQGGEVLLEWEDGDEDVPSTFSLRHVGSSNIDRASAYETFEKVRNDWWKFLVSIGLASGPQYSPEFMQNKLRRIFGSRDYELPPRGRPTEKN
ncbi:hypothetical protein N2597_11490 [Rhizobium sophoriradicis]|uniref:hypothetical protein n=1 Tax=Rhizobium sophoriradicis TaxID=1535245 RepID=UPI001612F65E|nr:hypothetical protein N2597_11490 [Rhizobium leguminosarum bv. phaseoli]